MARTLIKAIVDTKMYTGPSCVSTSTGVASASFLTASNSPTLTFTPLTSGTYKVYSNAFLYNNTAGGYAMGRIFNTAGSASLVKESQADVYGNSGDHGASTLMQSVYTLTAGVSYSFDIQLASFSGVGSTYIGANPVTNFCIFAEKIG